jgi:formyl-CoA transferase
MDETRSEPERERRESAAAGPLAGLRVLDVATLFAAPQIASLLGDLGADVVKVEPPGGDPLRAMGAMRNGLSLVWAVAGRNKRSIALDLARDAERALFRRLVERADVLVENLPARTLARWQLRFEDLHALNPRLVMVSVSCYGRVGPYAERPGNGTLAEAFGGLTHMTGLPDGPPMLTSLPIGDVLTALWGALGAVAACYGRDARSAPGRHVDVAMYEPILQLYGGAVTEAAATGRIPTRSGNRIPGSAPRNLYRTSDGAWLAVSALTDRLVQRILALLGEDGPAARERFGTAPARRAHADELDAVVAAWIARRPQREVVERFLAAEIPVTPVNDLGALLADPHLAARANIVRLRDPRLGELDFLLPVPRIDGETLGPRSAGPAVGERAREVLADWLGAGDDELARLAEAGVLRSAAS